MKKLSLIIILILVFLSIDLELRPAALAAWGRKNTEEKKVITDSPRANQELSSRDWIIYVLPQDPGKLKLQNTDVLNFSEGKFLSQNLSAQGYPATDYTLTKGEEGAIVWEALAANDRDGLVSWCGELKAGQMQGVFSISSPKGGLEDFSFTNTTTGK